MPKGSIDPKRVLAKSILQRIAFTTEKLTLAIPASVSLTVDRISSLNAKFADGKVAGSIDPEVPTKHTGSPSSASVYTGGIDTAWMIWAIKQLVSPPSERRKTETKEEQALRLIDETPGINDLEMIVQTQRRVDHTVMARAIIDAAENAGRWYIVKILPNNGLAARFLTVSVGEKPTIPPELIADRWKFPERSNRGRKRATDSDAQRAVNAAEVATGIDHSENDESAVPEQIVESAESVNVPQTSVNGTAPDSAPDSTEHAAAEQYAIDHADDTDDTDDMTEYSDVLAGAESVAEYSE